MSSNRKRKLMDLGAAKLADALLELTLKSDEADDLVERLIATAGANVSRFKRKLAALKRSTRFVSLRESPGFSRQIAELLEDLKAGANDPLIGVKLVISFFKADAAILNRCDDSDGCMGDIFRFNARDLFVEFASQCDEKHKIVQLLIPLLKEDSFGVRNVLVNSAVKFMAKADIRSMIKTLYDMVQKEQDEYKRRNIVGALQSLSAQIKDALLFEKTKTEFKEDLGPHDYMEISRVYLESGDAEKALIWVKKIPIAEFHLKDDRERLLIEIYRQMGDTEKLAELLDRNFRLYPSKRNLSELLAVIGESKREEIISKEVELIRGSSILRLSHINFLLEIGEIEEAEKYILAKYEQLDGIFYAELLPLAKKMELEERYLAASLIYRELLGSILKRAYTKAYPYGLRYLKKLDKLAGSITQWGKSDSHDVYKEEIYRTHYRKKSFWSKYEI